jgi:hypothetical protein
MLRPHLGWLGALTLVACQGREGDDPESWFDKGQDYDVLESVTFTDENYDFPENNASGIASLVSKTLPIGDYDIAYGEDDQFVGNDCQSVVDTDLPMDIEGIVTIFPRYYIKVDGCDRGEEKYYGSFFIQDRFGALFALGDTKNARFTTGARVKIRVRGVRSNFDLNMIASYDLLEVDNGPYPIYFETTSEPFDLPDIGKVWRIRGVVENDPDTFGAFTVLDNNGNHYGVQLDAELNRRDVAWTVGTQVQVTGPLMYSYSEFNLVVMQKGQIEIIDP